ncbi:amidohydrolase [Mycobacteroides abscessus]|uniref:amidohydrolase n=1 Tax=Mycobacteroides abscessus TaxID=36809 RepID=UPI000940D902|nr:amidohydrolase [Mycobacteroides abscessus]MDM2350252.1 amidohydrolase family protein [Mycobacteroides abscessus]MDM2356855.1 amidohydrolase family protein [Mycobacteroides abscessus]QSN53950.1 amidohydrolase family protein [Mycobacteroides abscessus subsp. abscessus]
MSINRRQFVVGGAAATAATTGLAALAGCGHDTTDPDTGADLIFVGGPVVTVDGHGTTTEALAVARGKIAAVGSRQDVMRLRGAQTDVIELDGLALLPAFVEAHSHPSQIAATLGPPAVDVRPFVVPTGQQVMQKLADTVRSTPKGTQVLLYGIDVLLQPDLQLPTRTVLDALAPDHPVIIVANSGHAAYANTASFRLAGITRDTPNPVGAEYVHGPDGELTGEVREAAALTTLATPYLRNVAEPNAFQNLHWAFGQLAAVGIATASEHSYSAAQQGDLYRRMAADPGVKLRIRAYEMGTPELAKDPTHVAGPAAGADQLFAQIGMKLWADGSPWQGNIFTSFPYLDTAATRRMGLEPHHHGGMNYTPAQVTELATAFIEQGWQLACHVHGDRAIDVVLDAYEKAQSPASLRSRLEHVGAMTPAQFQRAARLGVHPSLFIEHVYFWGDPLIDELFGQDHGAHWMSAKSALDAGLRISFHNDGNVSPPDPLGNIATAVTRMAKGSGRVLAPEQRISVTQAVRAQTIDAAWQLHLDNEVGSLEVGKYADLVVLSADPHAVDPQALRDISVRATYLAGRQTYAAPVG